MYRQICAENPTFENAFVGTISCLKHEKRRVPAGEPTSVLGEPETLATAPRSVRQSMRTTRALGRIEGGGSAAGRSRARELPLPQATPRVEAAQPADLEHASCLYPQATPRVEAAQPADVERASCLYPQATPRVELAWSAGRSRARSAGRSTHLLVHEYM
jgi:hypothetical protein